jgi:hypothetical protein
MAIAFKMKPGDQGSDWSHPAKRSKCTTAPHPPHVSSHRIVGLAPDYISRLARAGLIDGRLNENLWVVDLASLKAFIIDQERQKEIRRVQLARQRRKEQILAGHPSALAT